MREPEQVKNDQYIKLLLEIFINLWLLWALLFFRNDFRFIAVLNALVILKLATCFTPKEEEWYDSDIFIVYDVSPESTNTGTQPN